MPQPTARASSTGHRFAAKAVLVTIVALALMACSALASERFVPSLDVLWLKLLVNAVALSSAVITFIALQRSLRGPADGPVGSRDSAFLSGLYGVFMLVFLNTFLYGVLPLLHRLADARPVVRVEPARADRSGGRGCGHMALLPGDSMWMRRRLCRITQASHDGIASTGRIELTGTVSYFGMAVHEYRAARADGDATQKP